MYNLKFMELFGTLLMIKKKKKKGDKNRNPINHEIYDGT